MFVGSDLGGQTAATLMSVVATRRLLRIDTLVWFRDVLTRIAQGHPLLETASRRVYPAAFPAPLGILCAAFSPTTPGTIALSNITPGEQAYPDTIAIPDQGKRDFHNLDDALHRLASLASRQAKVVELRYFGGMTEDEIATHLGVCSRTIKRDWTVAKAWLHAELAP